MHDRDTKHVNNPNPDPLIGETLGGYRIEEAIGRGGMGLVYRARQLSLDRAVALKVLPTELAENQQIVARFQREIRLLSTLSHPNIVAIYDGGIDRERGLSYYVMELVDGVTLRDVIEAKELRPEQALALVPPICDALAYAHSRGLVHRDIKPANLLLDQEGRVKIADFGLSRLIDDADDHARITQTHQLMGTIEYMAPEQREGAKLVDHRADIYSLGVVIYEMLTGELPIGRFDPPSRKVQVDVRLDDVVLRVLEKDPARRYQQVSDVGVDVRRFSKHEQSATPTKSREPQSRPRSDPALQLASPSDPELQPRLSRLAIASFVLGCLPLALIAVILLFALLRAI